MNAPCHRTLHPAGFSWVMDGLAGMAHPNRLWSPLDDVLAALADQGVGGIVSLTEHPLNLETVSSNGFVYLHTPISDFGVPDLEMIETVNAFVDRARSAERGVVIHCGAGMGRTGTLLACYLVHIGVAADEAMDQVRTQRPGSIETPEQENVVKQFEVHRRRSALN